eukprot:796323-Prymnesium_polylepis.2
MHAYVRCGRVSARGDPRRDVACVRRPTLLQMRRSPHTSCAAGERCAVAAPRACSFVIASSSLSTCSMRHGRVSV